VGVHEVPDACLVLAVEHAHERLLTTFLLVFVERASLLQLFECHLELPLALEQIPLVGLLLLLEELAFPLPQGLIPVVGALQIAQLSLCILHLRPQLENVFGMGR